MALLDRLIHGQNSTGERHLCPHDVIGMLKEWARGAITRQYVVDNLLIVASDESDLDWLKAQYDAQSNATAKQLFLSDLWSILLLAENGYPGYSTQSEVVAQITSL